MATENSGIGRHFASALKWVAVVVLFGLAPFIFLHFISILSEEHIAEKEIEQLVEVRYILFVCCAITGAVMMDFFRAGIRMKSRAGTFAVYVSPFIMLVYLFLKYLLVYVQFDDMHDYGPVVLGTRAVAVYTLIYALLGRMLYNIKIENAGRNISL